MISNLSPEKACNLLIHEKIGVSKRNIEAQKNRFLSSLETTLSNEE
jgi:hypothetical protein